MDHLQKVLVLLMVAGIPAAAPPLSPASSPLASPPWASDLCVSAGSLAYRLARTLPADLRVRIDPQAASPDLRLRLVDGVENADFALVDDASAGSAACLQSGRTRRVRLVDEGSPADLTIAFSNDAEAALKLYVHSDRVGQNEAAALFAAMHNDEHTTGSVWAEDGEHEPGRSER